MLEKCVYNFYDNMNTDQNIVLAKAEYNECLLLSIITILGAGNLSKSIECVSNEFFTLKALYNAKKNIQKLRKYCCVILLSYKPIEVKYKTKRCVYIIQKHIGTFKA